MIIFGVQADCPTQQENTTGNFNTICDKYFPSAYC